MFENLALSPVSVVIVNYNVGDLLTECVAATLPHAAQVVVVDNASSDDSLAHLARSFATEKRLHVIRSDRNLGFAAGCNLGGEAATATHVLFLNPDCVLEEGSLARMLDVLMANPQAGMLGGLLVGEDGIEQGGGRRAMPTPWRSFVRAFGLYRLASRWPRLFYDFHLHNQPLPNEPIKVEAISGACMLVKREALKDVGPWDEGYFLHCEDLDWCMRFRQKGWKILFVPDAKVVHHQGTCSRSRPIFVEWHKHKGMMRFYRKFFRDQYPKPLWALVALGVWLRFGLVAGYYGVRHAFAMLGRTRG